MKENWSKISFNGIAVNPFPDEQLILDGHHAKTCKK